MKNGIVVSYDGIEIAYQEPTNRWRFELRGRERFAESLVKAKEAIDKPDPVKKKAFERIKAYMAPDYRSKAWRTVEVTSIADTRYGEQEVWISEDGERRKVRARDVFTIDAHNDTLISDLRNLRVESKRIEEKIDKCTNALTVIALPKEN